MVELTHKAGRQSNSTPNLLPNLVAESLAFSLSTFFTLVVRLLSVDCDALQQKCCLRVRFVSEPSGDFITSEELPCRCVSDTEVNPGLGAERERG